MFRNIFTKLFRGFKKETESKVEEESPPQPDVPVSFCNPFSAEDIYKESESITDFLNKLENK